MKNTIHIANFGLIHKYCAMVLCQQHFFMLGSGTCSSVSDIYNECELKWPDGSDLFPPRTTLSTACVSRTRSRSSESLRRVNFPTWLRIWVHHSVSSTDRSLGSPSASYGRLFLRERLSTFSSWHFAYSPIGKCFQQDYQRWYYCTAVIKLCSLTKSSIVRSSGLDCTEGRGISIEEQNPERKTENIWKEQPILGSLWLYAYSSRKTNAYKCVLNTSSWVQMLEWFSQHLPLPIKCRIYLYSETSTAFDMVQI